MFDLQSHINPSITINHVWSPITYYFFHEKNSSVYVMVPSGKSNPHHSRRKKLQWKRMKYRCMFMNRTKSIHETFSSLRVQYSYTVRELPWTSRQASWPLYAVKSNCCVLSLLAPREFNSKNPLAHHRQRDSNHDFP